MWKQMKRALNRQWKNRSKKARENQNFSAKLTVDNDLFKELDASVTSTFAGYDALTTRKRDQSHRQQKIRTG